MVTPQSQNVQKLPQKCISEQSPNHWKMVNLYVLCSKNILMKLGGYQQPTCLCVKMEFVVGTSSLSCELFSLSEAAFVHVRPAQLCTKNGVSIYMCSAVEVTWLAQNIRHSSTRV